MIQLTHIRNLLAAMTVVAVISSSSSARAQFGNANIDEAGSNTISNVLLGNSTALNNAINSIPNNTNAIGILNGDDTITGSVDNKVKVETDRALAAEGVLQNNITAEETRALAAEGALQTNITTLNGDDTVTGSVDNKVKVETDRALAAEGVLQNNITAEETRALAAEGALQTELDDTQTGAGLAADGSYQPNGSANYISAANSLADADNRLDQQVGANAAAIGANGVQINRNQQGIAGALAMSRLPSTVGAGKDASLSTAIGTFAGETAVAIGGAARLSDNLFINMGSTFSQGGGPSSAGFAGGVTYEF